MKYSMLRKVAKIVILSLCSILLFSPFPLAADRTVISNKQILRSSSELDYPPFALVRPDGTADGFSVELLKSVASKAGFKVEVPVGPWHEIKQKLIDGELDVLPLVSFSADRDRVMDFTTPYLRMRGAIFVRAGDNRIKSKEDLKNKEVIVMRGDTAHEYAVKEKLSNNLILTDNFGEAMKMLAAGEHDAVVIQHLVGLELIKRLNIKNVVSVSDVRESSLKPTVKPIIGFEQKFCFAVKEGDVALLARLNEGLAIAIADGAYDALYAKWFGPILPAAKVSMKQLVGYLLFILVPILFVISVVGLWLLKRQVADKTANLRREIQERKKIQIDREKLIRELQIALMEVKKLSGLLPICASCKKIRDDKGYWNQIESYIKAHSEAEFSHGICPDCAKALYGDLNLSGRTNS